MLTGARPPDDSTSASRSRPPGRMRNTEISSLPGSVARRYRPSAVSWSPPAEPNGAPVPAPPASNGEPAIGVSDPSARRSKPAIEFRPAVFWLT